MDHIIIQTAFLGDALLSVPLLRNYKEHCGSESLGVFARKPIGELLQSLELIDFYFEVDKSQVDQRKSVHKELKSHRFCSVISPHYSARTQFLVNSMKADLKIGFKNWWNGVVFDRRVERPMELPDALRQLWLLQSTDWKHKKDLKELRLKGKFSNTQKRIPSIPRWASMGVRSFLNSEDSKNNSVFIAPGSVWATKRWTPEHFAKLSQQLVEAGYDLVFIGSSQESELCNEIITRAGVRASQWAGKTSLLETLTELSRAQALFSNDSGAMHMGSLAEVPTVAMFGPTVLEIGYRPWNDWARVCELDLDCRPCGKHGGHKCPLGTHACMIGLEPQFVWSQFKSLERTLSH